MLQQKITKLTPEQEALIPVYREKWRAIALSTERIDREKAAEAIRSVYTLLSELYPAFFKQEPEIIFFDSPFAALTELALKELEITELEKQLNKKVDSQVYSEIGERIQDKLRGALERRIMSLIKIQLKTQLLYKLENQLIIQLNRQLNEQLMDQLESQLYGQTGKPDLADDLLYSIIHPEEEWAVISFFDFCISVLNCNYPQRDLTVFEALVKYCGWILPFEKICIVCDRPTKLSLDNENRLHASIETAISFADGYSLYSYHGVTLPEKYGKIHPNQWQSKWLLEETNSELRRVLIQEIGYSKICQELQAIELDCWQEYTLLKIDVDIDIESIYLLKMTCPSTGFIHALRVPPNINSAQDAIRWVNWGIDPEEFSVQT